MTRKLSGEAKGLLAIVVGIGLLTLGYIVLVLGVMGVILWAMVGVIFWAVIRLVLHFR